MKNSTLKKRYIFITLSVLVMSFLIILLYNPVKGVIRMYRNYYTINFLDNSFIFWNRLL